METPIKSIYAVSSGCYSDYGVHAVCEDKATADAWVSAMQADSGGYHTDARVERLDFIPAGVEPFRVTTWSQNVELWDDGRTETRGLWSRTELAAGMLLGIPPSRPRVRYVRAPCHKNLGGRLEVTGDSEEMVAKVVGERVAMWKAGAWAGPQHSEIVIDEEAGA